MSLIGNIIGFSGYYNHARTKIDKAEKLYKKALDKGMDNPSLMMGYGMLLLKNSEFKDARDLFRNALRSKKIKSKMINSAKLNLALAEWKIGNLDIALGILEELHKKYRCGRVYGALGYILMESGDIDRALEYNEEAYEYDPEDAVIVDNLAQVYFRLDRIDEAHEHFKKAEELRPNQADTQYYLGCIYYKKGDIELAKEKLNKALECRISPLNTISKELISQKLKEIQ